MRAGEAQLPISQDAVTDRQIKRRVIALYQDLRVPRLYTMLKMAILPLSECVAHLPVEGRILDVGCGYGYLANYLSLQSPRRQVVGYDVASDRVQIAQQTIGSRRNVEFLVVNSPDRLSGMFDSIVMTEVLHHMPYEQQGPLLASVFAKLKPGGSFVMREGDKGFSLRYALFNYFSEWVLYCGKEKLKFRSAEEWARMLTTTGYELLRRIPSSPLFPYLTVTFICAKPLMPAADRQLPQHRQRA